MAAWGCGREFQIAQRIAVCKGTESLLERYYNNYVMVMRHGPRGPGFMAVNEPSRRAKPVEDKVCIRPGLTTCAITVTYYIPGP